MMKSSFREDLNNEQVLGNHLDKLYSKIFDPKEVSVSRISDNDKQYAGIDLTIEDIKSSRVFNIDEKAQLDYINSDLPTFAFETSYLKGGEFRQGWLYDESKVTDYYFLITSIHTDSGKDISKGIKSVKIHSINRRKLQMLLANKGLTQSIIEQYDKDIRGGSKVGLIEINELNRQTEGGFYYSKDNKNESPINLVLKLSYLVKQKVGKIIFEP